MQVGLVLSCHVLGPLMVAAMAEHMVGQGDVGGRFTSSGLLCPSRLTPPLHHPL